MELAILAERLGDDGAAAFAGAVVGLLFGAFAQRSRFCLRAATIEVGRRTPGPRLAVWLVSFAVALTGTQLLIATGAIDVSGIRAINMRGSLSGAMAGGALFGIGMVLARGCPSRLLVLSGQGNLRAVLSGLVFAVAAQATIAGFLSPLRNALASLWTIDGSTLAVSGVMGLGSSVGLVLAAVWVAGAILFLRLGDIDRIRLVSAIGAGSAIVLGWYLTYRLSLASFDPLPVKSVTFSGPSAHTLMLFLSPPDRLFDFDIGLVLGVFGGSFLAAKLSGELKLEGFEGGASMRRYLFGAVLMGFGAMLAGGCAVGSVSNAVVLATVGWVALLSMWASSMIADSLFDRPPAAAAAPA